MPTPRLIYNILISLSYQSFSAGTNCFPGNHLPLEAKNHITHPQDQVAPQDANHINTRENNLCHNPMLFLQQRPFQSSYLKQYHQQLLVNLEYRQDDVGWAAIIKVCYFFKGNQVLQLQPL